jgi:hypothetical protein
MNLNCLCFLLIIALFNEVHTTCENPQKSLFFSFNSLSKKDHISDMFEELNEKLTPYYFYYNDAQDDKRYNVINFKYQVAYSQHYQT